MTTNFDEAIERRNTHSEKWDDMEREYGISSDEGIAMWIADMDFRSPQSISDAMQKVVDGSLYTYYGDKSSYFDAICNWMDRRHGWKVDPSWILSVNGVNNGIALAVQAYTQENDGVILFTPVYHSFATIMRANNRRIVESELVNNNGRYQLDLDALEAQLQGDEKLMVFCSPHNPGGRVWSLDELQAVAAFCIKHDLILVSDEIHHDLVYAGSKHTVMALAAPEVCDRLVIMSATTKAFNIAGAHIGNATISNEVLRKKYIATMNAGKVSASGFGYHMAEAAYNGGEEWLEDWLEYMAENKRIFDEGINAIPGLRSMKLEATYLAWVDFADTGLSPAEFTERVVKIAKVAPNSGDTFGKGGDNFLRFNIATRRELVVEAVKRIAAAFADLQ
ncbi:MAG: pyridoxal phosphate-dependent aminotransferase [Rhodobacteraceae bacterium]|nr:pyridoxal phosphate-dependent aminotransferase [Paracoccaceae bacterium]